MGKGIKGRGDLSPCNCMETQGGTEAHKLPRWGENLRKRSSKRNKFHNELRILQERVGNQPPAQ